MRTIFTFGLILLFSISTFLNNAIAQENNKGKALVEKVVQAVGGIDQLYQLKDVQYDLRYISPANGPKIIGTERYIFDGELSWAKFSEHGFLGMTGNIEEGYDGKNFWIRHNGKDLNDEKAQGMVHFLRKTNFYWFTMMFKLLDPGLNYEYVGKKKVNDNNYELVKVTFEENVGDAQDTYLLYINRKTKLVDQFLFTVMAMGAAEPYLMKIQYQEIDGLKIPSNRKYIKANWDGEIDGDAWINVNWENIKFNNGFAKSNFEAPKS